MNPLTATKDQRPSRLLLVLLPALVLIGIVSPTAPEAALKPRYTIKPPPQWIADSDLPVVNAVESDKGIVYLLSDQQIRVTDRTYEEYTRSVKKILNQAALEDVSQVRIDFEPSYQKLTFHHIWIERDGRRINALVPNEINIIQQETELDQQLYNGTLTAVAILKDLRTGDVIDCAFSLVGENPVLGGKVADTLSLSRGWPVKKLTRRLLLPRGRDVTIRATNAEIQPVITARGNETEYKWELNEVRAIESEDSTPSWFDPFPSIQLSEFTTWDEVVRWNLPLFEVTRSLSPALKRQIDRWQNVDLTTEARFLSALRFVQDEIRYMGIELGPYSHRPNDPSTVFERRFGDCKDKSLLLSSILHELGIEAFPALVNTDAQNELARELPSPYAFDHCIVKARVDGTDYWVDPTVAQQRGGLSQLAQSDYGYALEIREGVKDLEKMPEAEYTEPATLEQETFTITDSHSPVMLEVTTTYRKAEADSTRYNIARKPIADMGKDFVDYYSATFSMIEADGLPTIEDDPESNILVVREKYRIPDFWKEQSRWLKAGSFYDELEKPDVSKRSMPLAVNFPVYIRHITEIRFPEGHSINKESRSLDDESIHFDYRCSSEGNTVTLDYSYRSVKDNVPVERIARHLDLMEQIRNAAWYEVKKDVPTQGSDNLAAMIVVGGVALAVLGLAAFKGGRATLALKRRKSFKRNTQPRKGDGPETAIVVDDETGICDSLGRVRCSCGAQLYKKDDPLTPEGFLYDGRRLMVVRLSCAPCGSFKDIYFNPSHIREAG